MADEVGYPVARVLECRFQIGVVVADTMKPVQKQAHIFKACPACFTCQIMIYQVVNPTCFLLRPLF